MLRDHWARVGLYLEGFNRGPYRFVVTATPCSTRDYKEQAMPGRQGRHPA